MKESKRFVEVDENITVADLAGALSVKSSAVVKALMGLGMMASVNQILDMETATLVSQEFGYEVRNTTVTISDILKTKKTATTDTAQIVGEARPPVITIMGHVDHGKTSLLDAIRAENVAGGEAGGITQHIGAYQVEHDGRKITFLDTPGHEAFTSMRARGAQVTDVVILVVAADDGVMPQTLEAIAHAKAAKVPIIVAMNKMDKPGVNIERIQREMSGHGVTPEEWGGDSMFIPVSAKTKQGIPELLEAILLQADVLDLNVAKEGLASGFVIEARLDKSRGPIATILVTHGTLRQQDWLVAGTSTAACAPCSMTRATVCRKRLQRLLWKSWVCRKCLLRATPSTALSTMPSRRKLLPSVSRNSARRIRSRVRRAPSRRLWRSSP